MVDITKFHINNNYYVKIQHLKEDGCGCTAKFPENKLINEPQVTKTYVLTHNPYVIDVFMLTKGKLTSKTVEVYSSNIRLLVLQDIFLKTNSLGLSRKLIIIDGHSDLFKMLKLPQTQKEKDLETQLCVKFRELLDGNVVTSDIDGYEQVLYYFENGGL